jgi:hypothetical protein
MKRTVAAAGLVAGLLIVWVVGAYAVSGGQPDARASKCPGVATGLVRTSALLPLVTLAEVYQHLPAMKHAPEIDRNAGPGYLVVYLDDLVVPGEGPSATGDVTLPNAICLVREDGGVDIYYNVSRAGFTSTY